MSNENNKDENILKDVHEATSPEQRAEISEILADKPKYNKYFCQLCGCSRKLVETILDDVWSINEDGTFDTQGYGDDFEHTGKVRCEECREDWTGQETIEDEFNS